MKQRSFTDKEVVCNGCGTKFQRTGNRQWWCSRSCADKFKRRLQKKYRSANPKYHRICKRCGAEYETDRSRKIFCTISCKETYYNEKQKELQLRTPYRHRQLCNGNWRQVIKKAKGQCELCGSIGTTKQKDGLIVHHLDGQGEYGGQVPNHNSDNLMVLCRACHKNFHNLSLVFVNGQWTIKGDILRNMGLHFRCYSKSAVNENDQLN